MTIVHGPNGFGKTAILRLLNGFFNSRYSVFWDILFDSFSIDFDNNCSLEVVKESDLLSNKKRKNEVIFNFFETSSKKETFSISKKNKPKNNSLSEIESAYQKILISIKPQDNVKDSQDSGINLREEPEWLIVLKNNIHIHLIESQRLLNSVPSTSIWKTEIPSSMLPTVSAYSDEIAQLMRDKFTEYGVTAQSIDRTFPTRLVNQQASRDLTDEKLRNQLNELEETRSRLIEVGLLDKNENSDFQIQPQSIDENTRNILSVYVDDVEKKLSVFDEIASKIDLLRKIINNKFSYKEMNFSKEKGFLFKMLYAFPTSGSEILSPVDLSSGEQHELVLLYELLFKVKPNSLVLIDEPELSLHVGWQAQFLKDLQEITKLADLNILMATHSPDIIQDRWDLTVELKGPAK